MASLIQPIRRWLLSPRKADREAAARTERILKAFMDGDTEVLKAEIARVYGANFFALMQQQHELTRLILRNNNERD